MGSASRPAISTGSSSVSTASTGRGRATPAGRGSAWPSSVMWPTTTTARSASCRARARARRSHSPYRLRELVARMRAVLRRAPVDVPSVTTEDVLEEDGVRLDRERHEVSVNGALVPLPLKEFELLELLLANAGRVLTRDLLIDRVWG